MAIALQLLFIIIVFFIVLAAAYYFTRFVANKTVHSGNGRNLKVLEGISLNKDTSIFIVKVCDKYLVLSCTQNSVNTLSELDEGEIKFESYQDSLDTPFKKYFTAIMDKTRVNITKINSTEKDKDNVEMLEEVEYNADEKTKTNSKYNFKSKLDKFTNKNRDDI